MATRLLKILFEFFYLYVLYALLRTLAAWQSCRLFSVAVVVAVCSCKQQCCIVDDDDDDNEVDDVDYDVAPLPPSYPIASAINRKNKSLRQRQ